MLRRVEPRFECIVLATVAGLKTGYACDNPFYSREPDELAHREHAWCVEKGFHTVTGRKSAPDDYPVIQRLKRIELGFKKRSFIEFDFLVACESGHQELACGRNLMLAGKAPLCDQVVTDQDNDGVCDKLDECMWDPQNEKDPNTGICVINADVRNKRLFPLVFEVGGMFWL